MNQSEVYRSGIKEDKRLNGRCQVAAAVAEACKQAKATAPVVSITQERINELRGIAAQFPGAHRHDDRVEFALLNGPLNSVEALFLGSLHVSARILNLRESGYEIAARWVKVLGFDGELHRVHEWRVLSKPVAVAVADVGEPT